MNGEVPVLRRVRSFVLRQGRITPGQERALAELLSRYALPEGPVDWRALFGRDARRTLEIGFGDGDNLVELARRHPEQDFLGCEVHRPGVGRLLLALEAERLSNVRVHPDDALVLLRERIPDASLDAILIYFPDPWPKKRHHKRRLVQPETAELFARKLKAGGTLQLATDWEDYARHALEVLNACPAFRNRAADGGGVPRPAERPETKFERRGLKLGHQVTDLVFTRQ
ncbi:MAG TPA: tRNA (guanosine(46)-N7)-methyltransferase TrmB [Gammaproteobacteria bacterium]|nr:tRNA (guanosine(46)-N7)-methyltransferase TrmB [Gammaproteobacteria bacterium]